jgi:hypothetical protein
VPADLGEHALLELELLRDVLLDEVGLARHDGQVRRERERARRRQRRRGQPRKRGPSARHRATDPGLHLGLHVGGDDVDAEVQRARRPAAPDHARAEQSQRLDLAHRSNLAPERARGPPIFFNTTTII